MASPAGSIVTMTISHIAVGHSQSSEPGYLPDTAYAVLGLLTYRSEASGYELRQLALVSLRFFYWSPAQSQIYRELRRLAALGYVTGRAVAQDGRPDKVLYSISDTGRAELTRWLENAPVSPPVVKYDAALRLFFGHVSTPERLRQLLDQHRHYLDQLLARLHEVSESLAGDPSRAYAHIVAEWGEHLYGSEVEAVRRAAATLAALAETAPARTARADT
jgi:DNA-binding PadR family transcriptional regulator